MDKDSAIRIAYAYIEQLEKENPYADVFNYTLAEPRICELGFYFDYKYKLKNPNNPIGFGGAPGFIVNYDGQIEVVDWEKFRSLQFDE